jgi:hypothetical protein
LLLVDKCGRERHTREAKKEKVKGEDWQNIRGMVEAGKGQEYVYITMQSSVQIRGRNNGRRCHFYKAGDDQNWKERTKQHKEVATFPILSLAFV